MTALRWGIVGIGNIVKGTIAPAMVEEPACDLVAAVSRDRGRAKAFADRFGVERPYVDYQEMLADPDVDAVFIATPNALHAEQVAAAAAAGKHVLCDKPLATSAADAVRALGACEAAGVKLGINFHNRYMPWVREARRLIADGVVGEVGSVQVEVGSGTRHYDNWRSDPGLAGLGSVYNVGVHAFDFVGLLLDADPVEVTAMFDHAPGSGSLEMLAMVLVRFSDGTMATFDCNERFPVPRNDIAIHGSDGRILGESLTRSRVDGTLRVSTGGTESATPYPAVDAHRLLVAAFAESVLAGRAPDPAGAAGVVSTRLCDAISRSVSERRMVAVEREELR